LSRKLLPHQFPIFDEMRELKQLLNPFVPTVKKPVS
jgi:hypothetical protein